MSNIAGGAIMIDCQELTIGDTVVHVSGSGYPLIFVHGFTTTAEFWREQVVEYSKMYKVVRINLPGHGVSPRPERRRYTIEAFVEDLERVYRHLALDEAFLVGLSMGGTIAQSFAIRFPHLVRALVLVGATSHGLGPDVNVDNVLRAIESLGVVQASKSVIERSFGSSAPLALIDFAKHEVAQTPDFVAREAIASLNASDTRELLDHICIPTLVVVGDEDAITPPQEAELLAAGIPGSELFIIRGAGHFPMLEQPDMFNRRLSAFLERHRGDATRVDGITASA
ncbi:alpha/beta fold hydrolase [Microvirga sesbaniae]|uniref:alpha/beta fold hydrolase n=1 Tax=Microvirga sesbaniae TaxID=681392 RepID=UPI0021CA6572|nr:alpha/beta hydrolase [Microvirga sp. HBU67692]